MLRLTTLALLWVITSLLTLLLIAGHGPWAGRVILRVSQDHGLNSGDVPVLGLWVLGTICCLTLAAHKE